MTMSDPFDLLPASVIIETASGTMLDVVNPDPQSINIHDIAWTLSRLPRFGGHTTTAQAFNVAQHSIYVSTLVEQFIDGQLDAERVLSAGQLPGAVLTAISALRSAPVTRSTTLLRALLHDAHEAYTGDIITPIKKIPQVYEIFKQLETVLDAAIADRVGLPAACEHQTVLIKFCDQLSQAVESWHFMPSRGMGWELPRPSLSIIQNFPKPLPAMAACDEFILRFNSLVSQLPTVECPTPR